MRGRVVVVSGIDTGVGKTVVTGLLGAALARQGCRVVTQKLVQTGCAGPVADDVVEHRRLMGMALLDVDVDGTTSPYCFPMPASPHLAAAVAGEAVDLFRLRRLTLLLQKGYDVVLVEGAGGLLVPLAADVLLANYVRDASYPLVLVSSSRLGSINQTLLSIEACRHRGIALRGVVYNCFEQQDPRIVADTREVLAHYLLKYGYRVPVVGLEGGRFDAGVEELLLSL